MEYRRQRQMCIRDSHISGFKSDLIDKWESGEELPSITEAKKLASLYKVPFATFYLTNPPEKKVRAYTDRRTYNDTVYREISYELWLCDFSGEV